MGFRYCAEYSRKPNWKLWQFGVHRWGTSHPRSYLTLFFGPFSWNFVTDEAPAQKPAAYRKSNGMSDAVRARRAKENSDG
ncbi:MAG: hypothetical protein ACOVN5_07040 [Aquidulcibacter sp.]